MESFKTFLSEHKVLGEFKNSPNGIYNISIGDDVSTLLIYPSQEDKYAVHFKFTSKTYDILQKIFDNIKPEEFEYPYEKLKATISKQRKNIISSTVFTGTSKDIKKIALDYFDKKDNDLGLASTMVYQKDIILKAGGLANYANTPRGSQFGLISAHIKSIHRMVVNPKTKSIWVDNSNIDHANRIGKMGSTGKATYVIPLSDRAISDDRTVYKVLQSLVSKYKDIKNYSYIDVTSVKQDRTKVGDILNGAGSIGKANVTYGNIFKSRNSISVFHGTSLKLYKEHISKKGLVPDKGLDYIDKIKNHSEHNIYFTTEMGEARKYAVRASGGTKAVVLEVKIEDFTKIVFDEDALYNAVKRVPERVMKIMKVMIYNEQIKADWKFNIFQHTLEGVKEYGLDGTNVNPHGIRKYLQDGTKNDVIDKIISTITNYAIGGRAFTFAYKGRILPKNIKIKEELKSISYKDHNGVDGDWNKSNFKKKYSKVIKSIKAK